MSPNSSDDGAANGNGHANGNGSSSSSSSSSGLMGVASSASMAFGGAASLRSVSGIPSMSGGLQGVREAYRVKIIGLLVYEPNDPNVSSLTSYVHTYFCSIWWSCF